MSLKNTHFSFRAESKIMWIAPELQPILAHFPETRNKIIQLFDNDLNFRSMCEDFWTCTRMLEKLKVTPGYDASLENEYLLILVLLEKEVHDYLQRN